MYQSSRMFNHLRQLIRSQGPISMARFMEETLYDDKLGYYHNHDPIGANGDFITAPEISQVFGELIGLWCANIWEIMGKPQTLQLIELGPGHATLILDALRATKKIEKFHKSIHLNLFEVSSILRKSQNKSFAHFDAEIGGLRWVSDLSEIPVGPAIVIANEFFDALPVYQFQKQKDYLYERLVGLSRDMNSLVFTFNESPHDESYLPDYFCNVEDGDWIELSKLGLDIMRELMMRISDEGGAALIIDYGYVRPIHYKTLQAVKDHGSVGILEKPGEKDLSAHVNFMALKDIIETMGVAHGPISQGEFLNALGLTTRVNQLQCSASNDIQRELVVSGATRLVSHSKMGSLFKVLGASDLNLKLLPGFL